MACDCLSAPAITYKLDGRQYIAILVGFGGGYSALGGPGPDQLGWSYRRQTRRLIAFSLDGDANVPTQPPPLVPQPIEAANFTVDETLAAEGARRYDLGEFVGMCRTCHGTWVVSGGAAPDLRASPTVLDKDAFYSIVRDGGLTANGMPAYAHLTDMELESLRHYIRQQAEV